MINSNADSAMGILFPNSYDSLVPELVTEIIMHFSSTASSPIRCPVIPLFLLYTRQSSSNRLIDSIRKKVQNLAWQ